MRTAAVAVAVTAISAACSTAASHADPAQFPDISSYSPVNPQDYFIELPNPGRPYTTQVVRFLTPDGITCGLGDEGAGCTGNNFPGVPPASLSTDGGPRVNSIATGYGLRPTISPYAMDPNHPFKTLPPFHSITVKGVTCGVDDAKMTACKDSQGQGFVLSPNGSGWLPHV